MSGISYHSCVYSHCFVYMYEANTLGLGAGPGPTDSTFVLAVSYISPGWGSCQDSSAMPTCITTRYTAALKTYDYLRTSCLNILLNRLNIQRKPIKMSPLRVECGGGAGDIAIQHTGHLKRRKSNKKGRRRFRKSAVVILKLVKERIHSQI